MLYILHRSYNPNTAETNRVMAYVKNLSKKGITTRVVFLLPTAEYTKVNYRLSHVSFIYLWDKYPSTKVKLLNLIFHWTCLTMFRHSLKKGDDVYIYSQPEVVYCMAKRKDIHIYEEMTEHPDAIGYRNPLTTISWKKYYKTCKKLSGIFVISTELKRLFESKGVEKNKIHIINMTVDTNRFSNVIKEEQEEPYIAYCGVIYNSKDGVDDLIKAFSIVSQKHPNYKLYIIGPIPNSTDNDTNKSIISQYGLSEKIIMTGKVAASEMPQLLVNASICALARPDGLRAKSGFPTKLGEYLLSKNPVVLTDVGDISLFLTDKVSALIVPPNNPTLFAEKLCWAIEHPDKSKNIGLNGFDVAVEHFNAETETNKIINIIYKK